MSYQSTIDAMDTNLNPIGSPGSALQNPATAGAAGLHQDPTITGIALPIADNYTNATMALLNKQADADAAYDPVIQKGALLVPQSQQDAYTASYLDWIQHKDDQSKYATMAANRAPLFAAGQATATPDELNTVADAELDVGIAHNDYTGAKELVDTHAAYQQQANALTHGDPTAAVGSPEAIGVVGHAGAAMADLPSNMAILSGGQAAMDHIARVDAAPGAPTPADPTTTCDPNSLIRRGLKAITDAGKLLLDTAKAIAKSIGDLLGPIAQWTADMLKTLGGALKSVLQAAGQLVKDAMTTFVGWVRDAADAVAKALKVALNKAYLAFFASTDQCMKDVLKETMNINNVDQAALDKASTTA